MLGWLVSIVLFVVLYAVTGPAFSDTHETVYSTWAIAHGQVACAYPEGATEASRRRRRCTHCCRAASRR